MVHVGVVSGIVETEGGLCCGMFAEIAHLIIVLDRMKEQRATLSEATELENFGDKSQLRFWRNLQ